MRVVELDQAVRAVREHCGPLPHPPRFVTSGNFASPVPLLGPLLAELPAARLHALNAQPDLPLHDGVVPETTFVGPGFRRHPRLSYVPCRLSMVPRLFHGPLAPDVVVVHSTPPRDGQVSLGLEVNVLPAAIEAARARGALVIAQLNPRMPWTFGDAEISTEDIDLGVEVDVPLTTHLARTPSEDARLIGSRVAAAEGRRGFHLTVTNVPGPQFPLYAGGATMVETYPVQPLLPDHALAVGVTSYNGGVFYGITADRDALPDVDTLGQCILEALDELIESASETRQRAPRGRKKAGPAKAPRP